jgi:conjugative relaxase-like TrwC/TraI family protein
MLRITQSESSTAAKSYFGGSLRRGDYYMDGQELSGCWGGKAASMLGLDGPVMETDFCRMLENIRPDGERLTARTVANRRPGYDFTFDVPKSASLLYAIGGDERIIAAMKAALDETMCEIETEMHSRVRRAGAMEDRRTGNMIWADFTHFTSRPTPLDITDPHSPLLPDPHLHVHVYAINATWDEVEGQWKAGVFMQAKRDATYFQAAYHARLAAELQKLGYAVEATAKAFEVLGVPRELVETFSRRTKEVERAAEKLGITSNSAKEQLGAKTRHAKDKNISTGQLKREWESMAGPLGTARLKKLVRCAKEETGGRAVDVPEMAKEAVEYAIRKELERASEVSERRVLASALEKAVGKASVESIAAALAARPDVLHATIDGEHRMTTVRVLQEEERLMRQIRTRRGTVSPFYWAAYQFKNPLFSKATAYEQRVAVEAFMHSRDWAFGVIGRAGTGKTTLLKEIEAGLAAKGVKMLAVAPTAEAARGVLRQEGFASADTVKRLLVDRELQRSLRGNVLWVDEAGMLGNRDLLDLFEVAHENGACRVVLAGDPTQIRSVPRGDALRFLEENAGLEVARLTTILRQKNPALREAVEAISQADIKRGLSLIDKEKCIVESTVKEAHEALAKAYAKRVCAGKNVLAVCPTHAEGERITTDIRHELKEVGRLGTGERNLTQFVNQNWTVTEKSRAALYDTGMVVEFRKYAKGFVRHERAEVIEVHGSKERVDVLKSDGTVTSLPIGASEAFDVFRPVEMPISAGEKLRITQNVKCDGHRFDNGDVVTVKELEADGSMLLENGSRLPADFGHITHGYVSTADAAQSKTVDSVLIGIGQDSMGAADMRRVYVSLSRARHEARIYTDDKEGLYAAASRDTVRRFGMELVGIEVAQRIVQEDYLKEIEQPNKQPEITPSYTGIEREMEI